MCYTVGATVDDPLLASGSTARCAAPREIFSISAISRQEPPCAHNWATPAASTRTRGGVSLVDMSLPKAIAHTGPGRDPLLIFVSRMDLQGRLELANSKPPGAEPELGRRNNKWGPFLAQPSLTLREPTVKDRFVHWEPSAAIPQTVAGFPSTKTQLS